MEYTSDLGKHERILLELLELGFEPVDGSAIYEYQHKNKKKLRIRINCDTFNLEIKFKDREIKLSCSEENFDKTIERLSIISKLKSGTRKRITRITKEIHEEIDTTTRLDRLPPLKAPRNSTSKLKLTG